MGLTQKRESFEMKQRSLIVALPAAALLLAVLLLAGTAAAAKTHTENDSKDMESSLATSDKTEPPALPPIDAAPPSSFETATFGLG